MQPAMTMPSVRNVKMTPMSGLHTTASPVRNVGAAVHSTSYTAHYGMPPAGNPGTVSQLSMIEARS